MSQFSGNPFKLTAINFPVRVNVTATTAINQDQYGAWGTYTTMVMDKIRTDPALQAHMTALNRTLLDARTNTPLYQSDNSTSAPDNKIDYVVLIWRYKNGSPGMNGPLAGQTVGLDGALGSGGGYASVGVSTLIDATPATPALITWDGFTLCQGLYGIDHELFTHEVAHTLYDASHVNGNHGVSGRKFYLNTGNGMTTGSINAWERWFLGWAPLQCNGVSGDLTSAAALTPDGHYRLRDFITTGDALRIRLPNTYNPATGTYQYLWLENHQKISTWDQRQWITNGAGQPFPTVPKGIMAFVEDMKQNKVNPSANGYTLGANGLKYLSAAGNFDLSWQGTSSPYNDVLWGNLIYNFQQGAANPTGGQNNFMYLRGDKDGDGLIGYGTSPSGPSGNEYFHYSALGGTPTFGFMGIDSRYRSISPPLFQHIGLDSNPALTSNPDFDEVQQRLEPMQLSGVAVRLLDYGHDGSLLLEVRFNNTDVAQSTRWTGNLRVSDVPAAANGYDVNIKNGVVLTVDRSGTPNRPTPGPKNDFINSTYLTVDGGALFHVETGAVLILGSTTTMFVEKGSQLLAESGSVVRVRADALLSVQTQAEADALRQYGQLDLQPGGQLLVRDTGVLLTGRATAGVAVYPNPGQQVQFALTGVSAAEAAAYTYRLLTPFGRAIRQGYCAPAPMSLAGLSAGTYLLELTSSTGQRLTRRVQVNP